MIGYSISAILDGIDASIVHVEADVSPGIPQFSIVGLPDSSVREAKLRVRSAIKNSNFDFPNQRITVNLSPASIRKRGAGLDLAIAMAILRASRQIPSDIGARLAFCAELGLDGLLVPADAMVNLSLGLREGGIRQIVASSKMTWNLPIPDVDWYVFSSLRDVVHALLYPETSLRAHVFDGVLPSGSEQISMMDVQGHEEVKRWLCVAAVGRHHLMMVGPPGSGKTMMAERFSSLLPTLSPLDVLEVFSIHQAAGLQDPPTSRPPTRTPHHSITVTGLIGGTAQLVPGEVSLAHKGVLIVDELLEFQKPALESLREPLVNRSVNLHRGGRTCRMPADFQFIGTMNPCPCGQLGYGECRCLPVEVGRYWGRLSGALIDRMDMTLSVQPRQRKAQFDDRRPYPIDSEQISNARALRQQWLTWSESKAVEGGTLFKPDAERLLHQVEDSWGLSRRSSQSLQSVALSVAALEGKSAVETCHVEEAIAARSQMKPSNASRS